MRLVAEAAQLERCEQVRLSRGHESRHFLADGRPQLEAVAAGAADHVGAVDVRQPVDDRIVVGAHVVEAGIALADAQAFDGGNARRDVGQDGGRLLGVDGLVIDFGVGNGRRPLDRRVTQARSTAGPGAHQDRAVAFGPRIVAEDVVAPGERENPLRAAWRIQNRHAVALDMDRQIDAQLGDQRFRPNARRDHHGVRRDLFPVGRLDALHPAAAGRNPRDSRIQHQAGALAGRALRQRIRGIVGIGVAASGFPDAQCDTVLTELRRHARHGVRSQRLDLGALTLDARRGRGPFRRGLVADDPQHADLVEAASAAGTSGHFTQDLRAARAEPRERRIQIEGVADGGGSSGGSGARMLLLDQRRLDALRGKVKGATGAGDAGADNDDVRGTRHSVTPPPLVGPPASSAAAFLLRGSQAQTITIAASGCQISSKFDRRSAIL
jgi:hypothetical protein